ncbi:MAG: histidinol dehydrogenase [Buchnera aphidicola (Schlechtendalia peitan)]
MYNFLKIVHWNDIDVIKRKKVLSRPISNSVISIKKRVKKIIFDIKHLGDEALYNYTKMFDNVKLINIKISEQDIVNSELYIDREMQNSIKIAIKNIKKFHMMQDTQSTMLETQQDIYCKQIVRPIESVGLYVPGGSAPLLSTALMLIVPAIIAGCKRIILCSPPPITNEILYVCKIFKIKEIFQVGGAQAIAALGLGTETIPRVNKIFGPGNVYVTEAKLQISTSLYDVGIDMFAGPSEVLIVADSQANPKFIASDLLSQAEHGIYSQVLLVTYDINLAKVVLKNVQDQIQDLSRYDIIIKALKNSKIIIVKDLLECFDISNDYAPEHLMIQCKNSLDLVKYVVNAGSIFLGSWSPVAGGDYATGSNHVLPTYGSAKAYSGLSLFDFQRRISVQKLNKKEFKKISSTIISLSTVEKLDAHRNSITTRLSSFLDEI